MKASMARLVERYRYAPRQEWGLSPQGWIGYQLKIKRMQAIDFESRARYRRRSYRRNETMMTVACLWLMSPLVAIAGLGIFVAIAMVLLAYAWNAIVIAVLCWGRDDITAELLRCLLGGDWPGPKNTGVRDGY